MKWREREKQQKKSLPEVSLEMLFVLFYHLSYFLPKKGEKKPNLSFNIIFHLLFLVKQNNTTCFGSATFQHRKNNGAQHGLSHEWISKQLSMVVPFDSGVVSFTYARPSGSHFTNTKPEAKLNMTFCWHQSIHHITEL